MNETNYKATVYKTDNKTKHDDYAMIAPIIHYYSCNDDYLLSIHTLYRYTQDVLTPAYVATTYPIHRKTHRHKKPNCKICTMMMMMILFCFRPTIRFDFLRKHHNDSWGDDPCQHAILPSPFSIQHTILHTHTHTHIISTKCSKCTDTHIHTIIIYYTCNIYCSNKQQHVK